MKKLLVFSFLLGGFCLLQNCSASKKAAKAQVAYSYEKDIKPIMQMSCTPCHFPPDGRKEALNSYEAVKGHITDIITRVKLPSTDNKFMPFKLKKPALSDTAINVLVAWEKQGMPQ